MDEFTSLREFRADAPVPGRAELVPGRRRLAEALHGRRATRRRRSTDWRLTAVGAAAAVAAAVLVGTRLLVPGAGEHHPHPKHFVPAQVRHYLKDVDTLLGAAARNAERQPDPHPHAGQWVYVKSRTTSTRLHGETTRSNWVPYDDPKVENGKEGDDQSLRETYRLLAALPADDPAEVLKRAHAYSPGAGGPKAAADFDALAALLGAYPADPHGLAAVYRALETVDDVTVVGHLVTDGLGRPAVALEGKHREQGMIHQVLLDPETLSYVGTRTVAGEDFTAVPGQAGADLKPGDVMMNSAFIRRALVAHKYDTP